MKKKLYVLLFLTIAFASLVTPTTVYPNTNEKRALLGRILRPLAKIGFGAFLINTQWPSWYYTVVKPYQRLIREFEDGSQEESGPPSMAAKVFSTIGMAEAIMLLGDGVHDVWRLIIKSEKNKGRVAHEASAIYKS